MACSSPGTIRKEKPDYELTSGKSSKEIAVCIADLWENSGWFGSGLQPVLMRPTDKGHTVSKNNHTGGIAFLVDIDDTSTGSTTKLYKGGVIGYGKYLEAVRSCQN